MARMGFAYDELRAIKPDIVYVSNCGFGAHRARTRRSRPGARSCRRCAGLTFSSGSPDQPPAGWGFSYMDHMGADIMAVAILAGLIHRNRTGEGQWIDMSCTEAGTTLVGPDLLDYTVNGRPLRRARAARLEPQPRAARWRPHGIYPAEGDDNWVAIACRDDDDWKRLGRGDRRAVGAPTRATTRWPSALAVQDALDERIAAWTRTRDRFAVAEALRAAGVPAAAVQRPEDRIDHDPGDQRVGAVADGAPPRDGRRARRRHARAPVGDRLGDRARRPVPRRAQPPGALGAARARRRRDRAAGEGRRHVSGRSTDAPGPLDGLRVVELASASTPRSPGKLLGDLGADVIVVEPPGGHASRGLRAVRRRRRRTPSAASGGGTTTRRSAASCSTSTPTTAPSSSAGSSPTPTSCSRASRPARSPRSALDHPDLRADHERADLGVGHAVRARPARARTSPPPTSRCSPAAARRGAAATTTTRCRRCAAAATRRSTSAARSR